MDMTSIVTTLDGLKTAFELTKGIVDLKSAAEVRGKVIELQAQILSAQSSAMQAQADYFELKKRLNESERWATEAARYELKEISAGVFVYVVKETARGEEPVHWLCSICFTHDKKSILQFEHVDSKNRKTYRCHGCNKEIEDSSQKSEGPTVAIRRPYRRP